MKLPKNSTLLSLLVLSALSAGALHGAEPTSADINELKAKLEELTEKIQKLEKTGKKIDALPTVTIGSDGLNVKSDDGKFSAAIHAVIQADSRNFFDKTQAGANQGFLLRRARPILEGKVYDNIDFQIVPDFGGTSVQLFDAWVNLTIFPELQIKVGKFKTPFGLEQLQADSDLAFNERSLATDLVPNRDLGVDIHGNIAGRLINYDLALLNGVGDARNSGNFDFDGSKEVVGRLFFEPFSKTKVSALDHLGFGVAGTVGHATTAASLPGTTGGTLPGYTTDGQQQAFAYNPVSGTVSANGNRWRVSPQLFYTYGPFSLLGEYVVSGQKLQKGAVSQNVQNSAWNISIGYVLTGEEATFKKLTPANPVDFTSGHWGAWQLVARVSQLDLDDKIFPS
ncbi:MAG: porin, partial [Verrucomicrobiales bacterium]|nr:porin [Verrucomicrobiales bacterium]